MTHLVVMSWKKAKSRRKEDGMVDRVTNIVKQNELHLLRKECISFYSQRLANKQSTNKTERNEQRLSEKSLILNM